MSHNELDEYRSLTSASDARKFLTTFWAKAKSLSGRSIKLAGSQNIIGGSSDAEQYFEQFGRKTFAEETMPLYFPESYYLNEEFNDKGLIYLRHGEPHQKIITARSSDGPAESNESWLRMQRMSIPRCFLISIYRPKGRM